MRLANTQSRMVTQIKALCHGESGIGKCLGEGTPVLMYDGTIRPVEDVEEGDLLMGPDSTPRRAFGLHSGYGKLFKVVPKKGYPYIVNENHILSLKHTNHNKTKLVEATAKDFYKDNPCRRHLTKGWRVGVEFPEKSLPLDPYLLGCWLGDGSLGTPNITTPDKEVRQAMESFADDFSNLRVTKRASCGKADTLAIARPPTCRTNEFSQALLEIGVLNKKHIPLMYKTSSNTQRKQLLAGLIDSDGHLINGCYEITQKTDEMAEGILFLARSLGLAAYSTLKESCCQTAKGLFRDVYHRIHISGHINMVPVRVPRRKAQPRKQSKDVLLTGIEVEEAGYGKFFGFELDGDRLFLLGDFTVTHNTTMLGTLPEDMTLIVLAERSLVPLRNKNYPVVKVQDWDGLRELIKSLLEDPPKLVQELRSLGMVGDDFKEIKILAIDSLSVLSEQCKEYIVSRDRKKLISERTRGARETPEKIYEDLMTQEDWGLYRSRMASMVATFVHLPFHIIFTCLTQWTEDKRTGEISRTPGLNGKLALEVPAYFDLVLYMEDAKDDDGKPIRAMRTRHGDNIIAKDASGALDQFEPTSWPHIFGKILGKNGKPKKKGKQDVAV